MDAETQAFLKAQEEQISALTQRGDDHRD